MYFDIIEVAGAILGATSAAALIYTLVWWCGDRDPIRIPRRLSAKRGRPV